MMKMRRRHQRKETRDGMLIEKIVEDRCKDGR